MICQRQATGTRDAVAWWVAALRSSPTSRVAGSGSIFFPRREEGNGRSAVAAIDKEIRVGGPNLWIGQDLRHADQTGVGKIHGSIRVFVE